MKIATWNVNSIRIRVEHVRVWLEAHQPDVLCIQETKAVDEVFPVGPLEDAGYQATVFGQKTYNGVAILVRHPLAPPADVQRNLPGDDADAPRRLLAGTVAGVRIINVYVPNGQVVGSEKFAYKLDWLARLPGC